MAKYLPEDIKVSDNSNILNPGLVYDGAIDGLPVTNIVDLSDNKTCDCVSKEYVDAGDEETLDDAKEYADSIAGSGGDVSLAEAKEYTDQKTSETLTSAKTFATSEANTALDSAKSYTDSEVGDAITEVKEYSDTNLATAKSYTDTEVGDAVTEVKAYSDGILVMAKSYTDAEIEDTKEYSDTNLNTAKTFATSEANAALNSAKSYTDTEVGDAITEVKGYSDTNLNTAKSYTDTEVSDALAEAKTYSDGNLATAKGYTDSEVADALVEAKGYSDTNLNTAKTFATSEAGSAFDAAVRYTDTEVNSVKSLVTDVHNGLVTYTNTTVATALTQAKTYAEGQASTAESNAKAYVDGLPFSSMTAVSASAEANIGFTNVTTDSKRIPTMAFMAYWNGRYNSRSSNLLYCNKGAFGDLATINKNASTANFLRGDGAWSNTFNGTFNMNGQLNVRNAKQLVCWSGANTGNFIKFVPNASTENYNQIASNNSFNYCATNHQFRNYGNTAWAPAYASTFANQSSIKYKTNVESMTLEEAENILRMRPVKYDYKNPADGSNCLGLIAEEVADIQTWGVVYKEGEIEGLDYSKFVPQLIRLCQHQQEQINSLESKISELQSQIMEVSNNESG